MKVTSDIHNCLLKSIVHGLHFVIYTYLPSVRICVSYATSGPKRDLSKLILDLRDGPDEVQALN